MGAVYRARRLLRRCCGRAQGRPRRARSKREFRPDSSARGRLASQAHASRIWCRSSRPASSRGCRFWRWRTSRAPISTPRSSSESGFTRSRGEDRLPASGPLSTRPTSEGLVHRDVKPGNVLLEHREDGGPRLLCRLRALQARRVHERADRTGQWVGTLDYAAPEQIQAQDTDARTDVYALGCVLYWALAGSVPVSGRSRRGQAGGPSHRSAAEGHRRRHRRPRRLRRRRRRRRWPLAPLTASRAPASSGARHSTPPARRSRAPRPRALPRRVARCGRWRRADGGLSSSGPAARSFGS